MPGISKIAIFTRRAKGIIYEGVDKFSESLKFLKILFLTIFFVESEENVQFFFKKSLY